MTTENTDKGQTLAKADSQGHCALGDGFGELEAALNLTRSIKGYSGEQKPEWVYLLKLESILTGALEHSPNVKDQPRAEKE